MTTLHDTFRPSGLGTVAVPDETGTTPARRPTWDAAEIAAYTAGVERAREAYYSAVDCHGFGRGVRCRGTTGG